jgi:hypothetical protein
MSVVVRGERHLLRLPAARPFAFAICGSDFKGSCRLESIFRALSSPPDLEIKASTRRKRRGTEEVQRARTGRTDRRFANNERNDSVARNGESTRLGEKAAERKDLFLRAYAYVTAKAVTYKATARAKTGGSALGVVLFPLLASFTICQTLLTWRTPETGRAPMSHDFHITVQEIPDACDLSLCVTVFRSSPDAVRRGDLDGKNSHRRRQ